VNLERQPRGTFFALALIVAGALLFLDNLGILPIEDIGAFWPLAFVVYGLGALWYRRSAVAIIWSSTLIVAGLLLILGNLHILAVTAGRLWPLLLIAVGATLLVDRAGWGDVGWMRFNMQHWREEHLRHRAARWQMKRDAGRRIAERWQEKARRHGAYAGSPFASNFAEGFKAEGFKPEGVNPEADEKGWSEGKVNDVAVFFGAKRRVEMQDFRGGELVAVFGSIEVDLSLCSMQPLPAGENGGVPLRRAVLEASAIFGAIEIVVPRTWRVIREGTGVFGSYEDQTFPRPEAGVDPATLIIRGGAVFGSVAIKN
jgi:hypothetical protein